MTSPAHSTPPAQAAGVPRLLIVDDDEGLLLLMAEALSAEGYEVTTASSVKAAQSSIALREPSLIILDLKLQDSEGLALVDSLRRNGASVPFVVVTGQGDEKVAVEVMKHGALDYVMKDMGLLDRLPTVARRALAVIDQEDALVRAREEHERLEREILEVTERERQSIGADLHDNLGQRLTALELMCTMLKEDVRAQPPLASRLDEMGRMLREAIAQTRYLARGLVPVGSDPEALQHGLTELAEHTQSSCRIVCRVECEKPVAVVNPFAAGHLYRIAQEAVNNAVKHARASRISIRLQQSDAALVLEISDNGSGLSKTGEKRGIGLGVMRHRAAAIGAELRIDSKRGEGVTVHCSLPATKPGSLV